MSFMKIKVLFNQIRQNHHIHFIPLTMNLVIRMNSVFFQYIPSCFAIQDFIGIRVLQVCTFLYVLKNSFFHTICWYFFRIWCPFLLITFTSINSDQGFSTPFLLFINFYFILIYISNLHNLFINFFNVL